MYTKSPGKQNNVSVFGLIEKIHLKFFAILGGSGQDFIACTYNDIN